MLRADELWNLCLRHLEAEVTEQQFNTWLRPLQAAGDSGQLRLLAPNKFVIEWVRQNLLPRIVELVSAQVPENESLPSISIEIGSRELKPSEANTAQPSSTADRTPPTTRPVKRAVPTVVGARINSEFTFDNFVEGKSNHFAKAAALQVAENPGTAYNPLFLYGGVGLGKTHLMHAVGHMIQKRQPGARVVYVHSERFVSEMVSAPAQIAQTSWVSCYSDFE